MNLDGSIFQKFPRLLVYICLRESNLKVARKKTSMGLQKWFLSLAQPQNLVAQVPCYRIWSALDNQVLGSFSETFSTNMKIGT